jgi:hypothetical protein
LGETVDSAAGESWAMEIGTGAHVSGPRTTGRTSSPAPSSPGGTRCRRRSAKGGWGKSGSQSRPSRSNAASP